MASISGAPTVGCSLSAALKGNVQAVSGLPGSDISGSGQMVASAAVAHVSARGTFMQRVVYVYEQCCASHRCWRPGQPEL